VPVTFRKLPATVRIAEAAAKFEFSETIEPRHAKIATEAVGASMQDFGMDEDGNYDADIQETGTSMAQKDRLKLIGNLIEEIQQETESGHCPHETLVERADEEQGLGREQVEHSIEKLRRNGVVYEPATDYLKFVGWA